jgi:hypothetical protein
MDSSVRPINENCLSRMCHHIVIELFLDDTFWFPVYSHLHILNQAKWHVFTQRNQITCKSICSVTNSNDCWWFDPYISCARETIRIIFTAIFCPRVRSLNLVVKHNLLRFSRSVSVFRKSDFCPILTHRHKPCSRKLRKLSPEMNKKPNFTMMWLLICKFRHGTGKM